MRWMMDAVPLAVLAVPTALSLARAAAPLSEEAIEKNQKK